MRRVRQNQRRGAAFHDAALVHHHHGFGHICHDAQIMCHKDHGHAGVFLQILDQAQNLCLRGDIKRGRRFIRNQQFRLCHHRHSDHRALPHPAGHFKRIGLPDPFGIAETDAFKGVQNGFLGLSATHVAMHVQHFGHLIAQPVQGRTGSASVPERSSRSDCRAPDACCVPEHASRSTLAVVPQK